MVTPSFTPDTSLKIASGQWQITAYLQYQNCAVAVPPTPQVSTSIADVVVNGDGSALSVTSNGTVVLFQRTGDNTYAGAVSELNGTATLNVTFANGANTQAVVHIAAPCSRQPAPVSR